MAFLFKVTDMRRVYSTALTGIFCAFLLAGCASVSSTSQFYFPTTADVYRPKDKNAPIPIFGKAPDRPFKTIGRLRFSSDLGWRFMRESMLYNARANGADAVILRSSDSREVRRFAEVPPRTDWVPVPGPVVVSQCGKKGNNQTYYQAAPTYVPVFQPGYVRSWIDTVIGIDAEMIVFRLRS